MSSSSLDIWDMNSSSESIPALVVVTGVGGAATVAVEATALLLGCSSTVEDRIVASLALLFLVEGGMVATPLGRWDDAKLTLTECARSDGNAKNQERCRCD